MEEKHIMMDFLESEKQITASTALAMNEASSENIYNLFKNIFDKLSKEVKEIFAICYANNWYQLEEVQKKKITQEVSKLCGELNKEE